MKRNSPYHTLKWRVDCDDSVGLWGRWETIAAFNVESIAMAYAKDCKFSGTPPTWGTKPYNNRNYRVMSRQWNGVWIEIGSFTDG